jgi:hypothetical protein
VDFLIRFTTEQEEDNGEKETDRGFRGAIFEE